MRNAEIEQALVEIHAIRRQVAHSTEFRGYGPRSLFLAAGMAVVAGAVQWRWLPNPATHGLGYVVLWLSVAVLSAALIATEMVIRAQRMHCDLAGAMVRVAVLQFLPAGVAGLVLPFVLLAAAPELVWLVPGLWQVIFALGVFASCASLPGAMRAVASWFLLTGFGCVALGGPTALAPFTMAGSFGVGITLVGGVYMHSGRERAGNGPVVDDAE